MEFTIIIKILFLFGHLSLCLTQNLRAKIFLSLSMLFFCSIPFQTAEKNYSLLAKLFFYFLKKITNNFYLLLSKSFQKAVFESSTYSCHINLTTKKQLYLIASVYVKLILIIAHNFNFSHLIANARHKKKFHFF